MCEMLMFIIVQLQRHKANMAFFGREKHLLKKVYIYKASSEQITRPLEQ